MVIKGEGIHQLSSQHGLLGKLEVHMENNLNLPENVQNKLESHPSLYLLLHFPFELRLPTLPFFPWHIRLSVYRHTQGWLGFCENQFFSLFVNIAVSMSASDYHTGHDHIFLLFFSVLLHTPTVVRHQHNKCLMLLWLSNFADRRDVLQLQGNLKM